MLLTFFTNLRQAKVPVTLREYLILLQALDADLADRSVEQFYYLSRACLVKDERNLDKFDRVFSSTFKGVTSITDPLEGVALPEEWLRVRSSHLRMAPVFQRELSRAALVERQSAAIKSWLTSGALQARRSSMVCPPRRGSRLVQQPLTRPIFPPD